MTAVDTYVARMVASAPTLTASQRERLTGLLRPPVVSPAAHLAAAGQREAVSLR